MNLTTTEIESADEWHQILHRFDHPHPLQTAVWGALKSRWGWTHRMVTFNADDGRLIAAALLLKRQIPWTPFSIMYVPKGPIMDYEDEAARTAVLTELERIAKQEWAIFMKIDPDVAKGYEVECEPHPAGQAFLDNLKAHNWQFSTDQIQFRNTVMMDVTRDADDILADMKSKTRYNIRLSGRKGVSVRRGTPADFPMMIAMYRETAERDQFLIRPDDYYLDVWTSFYEAGMCQPLIAEYEGEPLGTVMLVKFGPIALYMYGASTSKERKRMPNYLLQWEAILWAQEQGCRVYDFWGAPDEFDESDSMWGVWRFKKGFHGRVVHHIGAWDYAARPLLYNLYTAALPKYLSFLKELRDG